jgi:hypothetical protein
MRELPHNLHSRWESYRGTYTPDGRVTALLTLQMRELPHNLHSRWESYRGTYTPDGSVTAELTLQIGELPRNLHSRWESYRATFTPDGRVTALLTLQMGTETFAGLHVKCILFCSNLIKLRECTQILVKVLTTPFYENLFRQTKDVEKLIGAILNFWLSEVLSADIIDDCQVI